MAQTVLPSTLTYTQWHFQRARAHERLSSAVRESHKKNMLLAASEMRALNAAFESIKAGLSTPTVALLSEQIAESEKTLRVIEQRLKSIL